MQARTKIIESGDGGDDWRKGLRHGGFRARCKVQFACDHVIVQRSVEGSFHLRGSAMEGDPCTAAGNLVNSKTLSGEPCAYQTHVGVREAGTVSQFLRREPLVVL